MQAHLARMQEAATAIQAGWRGMNGRLLARRLRAAIVIQRHMRGQAARRKAYRCRWAVVQVQRCVTNNAFVVWSCWHYGPNAETSGCQLLLGPVSFLQTRNALISA